MIECAWGASATKGSFFSLFKQRQCAVRRKNLMKVQVAIARARLR